MVDEELAVSQDLAIEAPVEEHSEEEPSKEAKAMAKLKEAIVVNKQEIGPLRLKLTVTVPRETLDERLGEEFTDLRREAMIPGFRKGHAPLRLVEKRFASDVGDQLKQQLIANGYLAAVEKEELKPLGDPLFQVSVTEESPVKDQAAGTLASEKLLPLDKALDHLTLPKEGPLTFSCELELKPRFELPKLMGIPIEVPTAKIKDADVDRELRYLRTARGTYKPVEDGAVEADDMLYTDMRLTVEGQEIVHEENFDLPARDMNVKGILLKGLGDKLIGRHVGDQVTLEATVPEAHENVDLRGKAAVFEFKIHEVKRLVVPPIDEEFLAGMGLATEDELREFVRSRLELLQERMSRQATHEQIGRYLVDHTSMEIPAGLSQRQTDRSIARRKIELYQKGWPQSEVEKAIDEMRMKAQDQVIRDLKLFFILEKIAEDREINVPEERINAAISQIAARSGKRFDRVRDELSRADGLSSLYLRLRDEQVFDMLLEDTLIAENQAKTTSE